MIEVENLRKEFGSLTAVADVSFTAETGIIFGLLGPNGAGKSTTIGCISGLIEPSRGTIRVMGHDVMTDAMRARQELGVVPQELALYEEISARENLRYWGAAYGLSGRSLRARVDAVLDIAGLADRSREPVKKFSGGMKRRLNFGCGIVHEPKVLLLDEPTVGVDPQSRERLLDMVRDQARAGTTVLYTTHYMEEAENLCERIAIVDHGKLITSGTLAELRAMVGERDIVKLQGSFDSGAITTAVNGFDGDIKIIQVDESSLKLSVENAAQHLSAIFTLMREAGAEIRETGLLQPSLESLFIKLTGKELRE